MDLSPEAERNFWELTARSPEKDGCWEWLGPDNGNGYGMYNLNGRSVGAHRVAWCLEHKQTLPSYHQVRRKCKNRACVRPNHLRRIRRVLAKSANGKKNKPYTVIRPPTEALDGNQNISDPATPKSAPPKGPRVERYMRETKEVKNILTALVAGFSQVSEMLYAHKKGLENLHVRLDDAERSAVDLLRDQSRRINSAVEMIREARADVTAATDQLLAMPPPVTAATAPPVSRDSDATSEKLTVEILTVEAPEETPELSTLLAQMYLNALGTTPTDQESEQLVTLFGYAVSESEVSRQGGSQVSSSMLFATWLESFQSAVCSNPELPPSVSEFQRLIERIVLPPALN